MRWAPRSPTGNRRCQKIRSFLELIGFDRIAIGGSARVSGAKAWKMRINAQITSDGWFLPPIFGSKASSGYDLLLTGPDVLPEAIQTALDPKHAVDPGGGRDRRLRPPP